MITKIVQMYLENFCQKLNIGLESKLASIEELYENGLIDNE